MHRDRFIRLSFYASRAERGEIDMHVVLTGVIAQGLRLPDLGVSIYPGQVALDHRVNVWYSRSAAAFIALLAEPQSLAVGATLVAADEAGRPYDGATQTTLADAVLRVLQPSPAGLQSVASASKERSTWS